MQNTTAHPSQGAPLRVFLVEDSPLILERLEEMVKSIDGADSVGHASGAEEAIRAILDTQPDAVVLDIRLTQGSGFDVLRKLREQAPDIAIFMLSNLAIEPYRRLAARLGAADFFDKSTEFWRMRDALSLHIQTKLD